MGNFFKGFFSKKNKYEKYSDEQLQQYILDDRQYIRENMNKPQVNRGFFGSFGGYFEPQPIVTRIRSMEVELDRRERAVQEARSGSVHKLFH